MCLETNGVGMQYGEEIRAGEKLGAGGLEQQRQARARASGPNRAVPTVLWKRTTIVWYVCWLKSKDLFFSVAYVLVSN